MKMKKKNRRKVGIGEKNKGCASCILCCHTGGHATSHDRRFITMRYNLQPTKARAPLTPRTRNTRAGDACVSLTVPVFQHQAVW